MLYICYFTITVVTDPSNIFNIRGGVRMQMQLHLWCPVGHRDCGGHSTQLCVCTVHSTYYAVFCSSFCHCGGFAQDSSACAPVHCALWLVCTSVHVSAACSWMWRYPSRYTASSSAPAWADTDTVLPVVSLLFNRFLIYFTRASHNSTLGCPVPAEGWT